MTTSSDPQSLDQSRNATCQKATPLLTFPCQFPIKVMGANTPEFVPTIAEIVKKHDEGFDPSTIVARPSAAGNYLGLTVLVTATSQEQLDAIYRSLSGHPLAKYVL